MRGACSCSTGATVANQRPSSDMRDVVPDSRDIEDPQAAPLSSGRWCPSRGGAPK
jgi:hypothetical protein